MPIVILAPPQPPEQLDSFCATATKSGATKKGVGRVITEWAGVTCCHTACAVGTAGVSTEAPTPFRPHFDYAITPFSFGAFRCTEHTVPSNMPVVEDNKTTEVFHVTLHTPL